MVPAAACVEEHEEVRETITTGPYGEQTVTLSVEDDIQVHEVAGASGIGLHGSAGGGPPYGPDAPGLSSSYPPGQQQHHC